MIILKTIIFLLIKAVNIIDKYSTFVYECYFDFNLSGTTEGPHRYIGRLYDKASLIKLSSYRAPKLYPIFLLLSPVRLIDKDGFGLYNGTQVNKTFQVSGKHCLSGEKGSGVKIPHEPVAVMQELDFTHLRCSHW